MKKSNTIFFLLFCFVGFCFSQTKIVKGTVLDEKAEPIIGVTVYVKGTTNATTTNIQGKFNITVTSNIEKLTFSLFGYEAIDMKITEDMKVKMTPSVNLLEEVVVTGMTTMDKRLFTGSADKLSSKDIRLDGVADISRALEGRSAGVSVQNVSGTFGTAPRIKVRGATSIYGNSSPLWVVDGIIMDNIVDVGADALSSGDAVTLISSVIAGLNADDIESFEILKDGSATAIYGARAMAGVIVVTTKKGEVGQSSINYTGEFTTRLVPTYNEFNIMNSQEQMGMYKEMEQKGWLDFAGTFRRRDYGVYGKMYELMNTKVPGGFALSATPEAMSDYLRSAEMRNTNWFDELFSVNVMQNHSVSISSGTEKTNVYASISAMFDPGWYKKSKVNRYTGNLNITHKILNNLSINLITNASYRKQQAPGTLSQDVDNVYGTVKRDFDINPYSYSMNTSRAMDPNTFYTRNYAPFNILHELNNNYMDIDVLDMKFQLEMKWRIIPQLEIGGIAAVKYNGVGQHHYIKDASNQAEAYRAMGDATIINSNKFLYRTPEDRYAIPITILPEGGIYQRKDYKKLDYDFRVFATWRQDFNKIHSVAVFGGAEVRANDRNNTRFDGWGLQYEMGEIPFYVYQYFKKGIEEGTNYYSMSNTRTRDIAFFGQATYGFDNRYSLSGTIRYEGSNKMGMARSARWLPTWNVGAAWNIHNENFMETIKPTLSYLKLRASYSLTGERGASWVTNSHAIISAYTPYRPFTGLKESAIRVSDLENSELTYEKKYEFSAAIEAGFLNNRFNTVFEIYNRNNFDLIGIIQTQGIGGSTSKYANVAEMKGHGYEITLGSTNIKTKNFSWNTDFIWGYTKTKVTKLNTQTMVMNLISGTGFTKVGHEQRALYSIPFVGLSHRGYPVVIDQNGDETSGKVNFQETIKTDFLVYEGPSDPPHTGSLQNTFRYKNFRLNAFITYAFGNVVRLNPSFKAAYSDLVSHPREFKNRWVLPGDEKYTNIPVTLSALEYNRNNSLQYGYNAYNFSTARVAKGDFIRMKEISLTYDFPKYLLGKSVKTLSLKLQATNLFLIYADKKLNGQDPEFFQSGGVSAPQPKQFTLTLRLGL